KNTESSWSAMILSGMTTKTVETVLSLSRLKRTPLKRGVNEPDRLPLTPRFSGVGLRRRALKTVSTVFRTLFPAPTIIESTRHKRRSLPAPRSYSVDLGSPAPKTVETVLNPHRLIITWLKPGVNETTSPGSQPC